MPGDIGFVFNPQSIAIIGVSGDISKSSSRYFDVLVQAGFPGRVYPVNAKEKEIRGYPAYPAVSAIPGRVDHVIIAVPAASVLEIIDDCAAKKVKTIQLFTAGFRETAAEDAVRLEELMVSRARAAGIRLIGPNCLGICNPARRIPLGPVQLMPQPGSFGFISQSGGHAANLLSAAIPRGIGFSKAVSFGNACDLDAADFLEYLAADSDTHIIGAYLEGVKDGVRLYTALEDAARRKPVLVWKGGRTPGGARTAASHTGSLATGYGVWTAAMRQAGAIVIESVEELVDTVLLFQRYPVLPGLRAAVISGIVDGGGGDCVSAADTLADAGIQLPAFTSETKSKLAAMLKPVGTIVGNPLDLGAPGANPDLFYRILELVTKDAGVDLVIVQQHADMLLDILGTGGADRVMDCLVKLRETGGKPILVISPPGIAEAGRLALEQRLSKAGIPVFPSLERCAAALLNLHN